MKAVLLAVLLVACQKPVPVDTTQPTPVVTEIKTAPFVLAVSKGGEQLGTITIVPGQLGTLQITGAIAAKRLIDAWAEVEQRGEVRVHMHMPTEDGSRGAYGARIWKPTDTDYAAGVQTYLKYEKDFEVEIVEAPPSGRSTGLAAE